MTIEIIPSGRKLGAEVRGIDIRKGLTEAEHDALLDAWSKHLVLWVRDQALSDDQHIAFSRYFGEVQGAPQSEVDQHGAVPPEIAVISNIVENGVAIGSLGAGEAHWHTDSSCDEAPPDASLLRAIEVPPEGGDTYFANMYAAYDTLPADLKSRIEGRKAIHDSTYTSAGGIRKGRTEPTDVREVPGAHHPLVRTHPVTGRKSLYLGRRLNSYVLGLPVEESESLLDALWAHATREEFTYGHKWRVGDLLIWDNRCTLHRRDPFDSTARRLMHRTQLRGSRPY